jgi:hypothetical protein
LYRGCFAAHFYVINVSAFTLVHFSTVFSLSIILMLEQLLLFISVILLVRSLLKVLSLILFLIHVNVLNFLSLWVNQCLVIFQSVLSMPNRFPHLEYKLVLSYSFVVRFFRVSCWLIKSSFDPLIPYLVGSFNFCFGAGLNPTKIIYYVAYTYKVYFVSTFIAS